MKILLTGDAPLAMVILSTVDRCHEFPVVVNFNPLRNYINPFDEIEEYLNMCSSYNDVQGAIQVYNDTPWSNLLLNIYESKVYSIKEKIYNMCGWKPDAIIHIYNSFKPCKEDMYIFDKLKDVCVYSLDSSDVRFDTNLSDVLNIICGAHSQ